MTVTDLTDRVRRVLATSGRTEAEVVIGYTYRALTAEVYGVEEPTPAQASAVRRAVAKLVANGEAERDDERLHTSVPWAIDLPSGHHTRRSKYGETTYRYRNPAGVVIRRTATDEDRERWWQAHGARLSFRSTGA